MQTMKQVFAINHRQRQVFGMSETDMLVTHFHDNRDRMQEAIDKGDVTVNGKYVDWERDIHEEITGGKVAFHVYGGNPNQMSNQDIQAMVKLLEFAPWAEWGANPESECPKAALKAPAQPDGEAMGKLQEGSDAMQAACKHMKTMFRDSKTSMTAGDCGSIPTLIKSAMTNVKVLEEMHLAPMQELLYNVEGSAISVSQVKQMLKSAAPAMALLTMQMNEIKILIQRHKSKKGEPYRSEAQVLQSDQARCWHVVVLCSVCWAFCGSACGVGITLLF